MNELNHNKIYDYRFKNIDIEKKHKVWHEIALWMHNHLGKPSRVLEPACGSMEFLLNLPVSTECWGIDLRLDFKEHPSNIHFCQGNVEDTTLPKEYFDVVWISNFLEHLHNPEAIQTLLKKMFLSLKPGGRIAIIGPNFKFCSKDYFNFADHRVCLTDKSLAEHLFSAGFRIKEIHPQFLPFSFTGGLPPSSFLTKYYLRIPLLWKLFGKQFLVIGFKES